MNQRIGQSELLDRLIADMRKRWRAGDKVLAESYVKQHLNLQTHDALLTRLVVAELQFRRESGEQPDQAEYIERFPRIAAQLRSLLDSAPHNVATSHAGHVLATRVAETSPVGATVTQQQQSTVALAPLGRFGGYELLEIIARGGMGIVYKARQSKANRTVALKMILAGQLASAADIKRFETEALAAATLDHPNIVPVFEVGEHEGRHFYSMGYVEGRSLSDLLRAGPLAPREAGLFMRQVADAVAYAHSKGIVHRDLKPQNILLTGDGSPRVADFGLAKQLSGASELTATGQILGTPNFMSPEQARGAQSEVGPLSDVYSLGAVLYCLLRGRPPFQAADVIETLRQVATQEPVSPRLLNAAVDRDLETIALRCLQKEPSKRYVSAAAFAADLGRFLKHEPILARPIGTVEKAWRWCRRNPRVALLLCAVAVLLIVVAVGSTVAAYEISLAKENAERNALAEQQAHRDADRNADKARNAEKLASDQAKNALDTIYDVVTAVDAKLETMAAMLPLRKSLLDLVMKRLNKISKDAANSGTADRTMGLALHSMGKFYNSMGRTEKEIEAYQDSLKIFERLMQENPEQDWDPFDAAISHDSLGEIGREIEPDPAKLFDHYERSLAIRLGLLRHVHHLEPSLDKRRRGLATSYVKLSTLAEVVGDPVRSRDYAREAIKASEAMDDHSLELLSSSYLAMARASSHLGNQEEARKYYRLCLDLRRKMANADATSSYAKQELARAVSGLGDLELELGHVPAAIENYHQAHDIFASLAREAPGNPEIQWYLANTKYSLATAKRSLGDRVAADEMYRECSKTREVLLKNDSRNPQRKIELMLVRARLGQNKDASVLAADVRAYAPRHPGMLFAVACCYALCKQAESDPAQRRAYAEKAVKTLRQAIDHGYRDSVGLARDPDIAPLRDHPVYQELTARLAS